MKRFHSSLLTVQHVYRQQLTMAEWNLLRAQRELESSRLQLDAAERSHQQAKEAFTTGLRGPSQGALMQGLLNQMAMTAEAIPPCVQRVKESQEQVAKEQATYQQLKAREDAVSKLLDKKRAEHRQQALRHEQHSLDDIAATRHMSRSVSE